MRRVVHTYYEPSIDEMVLVIHYNHQEWVAPKDTRMTVGHDVEIRYIKEDNTILVDDLFSDPKRVSFKPFESENAETWTLREDAR